MNTGKLNIKFTFKNKLSMENRYSKEGNIAKKAISVLEVERRPYYENCPEPRKKSNWTERNEIGERGNRMNKVPTTCFFLVFDTFHLLDIV